MKKYWGCEKIRLKRCVNHVMYALVIPLFLAGQINGQTQVPSSKKIIAFPELPRVSAYEAYIKFKAGKAIILHAGGEEFRKRHIMGSFNLENFSENVDVDDSIQGKIFRKLPKEGVEIFIYCY